MQSTITRDDFFNFKYDVEYSRESVIAYVRDKYLGEMKNSDQSSLKAALELLRKWDLRADSLNTSAAIALLALPKSFKMEELTYDKDEVTKKLYESITYLNENFGKINVPLGKVIRLKRGKADLPLSGGPDLIRAIYFKKINSSPKKM